MNELKKVISFRIDKETEAELKKHAEFWNLKDRELARKVFLDGLKQLNKVSKDIAEKQLKNKEITQEEAKKIGVKIKKNGT